ncbi:hypothetical protein L226DRAFT_574152 [Lentinus tigrinus ALCF2SS1-7]|uniref:Uncharacterized protein n=1 Tax=Lentinus tigrinus ALCF2SS1-6 TaxID=1328759 RepID=A0A5C2S095_9APHY|nr:hypothetical protein L227DRAFT_244625 [Lentinus tigrinus ALCF2SS1-6]RPD71143.1 hypothetical protein L226DRAFT_574152 [Lentinus tigrinus ALCF2SS1-7]
MLSLILVILVQVLLAEAPVGGRLLGHNPGSLTLAIPTLAVVIFVLGLVLILSTITKSSGITLAAFIFTVYKCTSLAGLRALGFLHVRFSTGTFGPQGGFSTLFVDCSAEILQPLRVYAVVALWIIALRASTQWLHADLVSTSAVLAACPGCVSHEQLICGQAADLKDIRAVLEGARSVAADTEARLHKKEDELAQVKGYLSTVHIQFEVVLEAFKARVAALEAGLVAARQDAATAIAKVDELVQLLTAALKDAKEKDTIIAEQKDELKVSSEEREAIKAELTSVNASKTRTETSLATKESLAVMNAKMMELLKAKVKDLERVASDEKAKANREQDNANLAKREAAMYKAKTERLEITTERQTRELEQKIQELKSCHEQLTELKHSTEDAAEANYWKNMAETLASDLKGSTTERIELLAQLNRVKTAYHESHTEVEELQHALKAAKECTSAAQSASGASQPSSPSAAQTSDRMYEQTASGKACDTRVRSLFAREHYAQMDAAMEAKEQELAAAHEEIALLKRALQGKGKGKSKTSAPTSATKKARMPTRTQPIKLNADKENAVPRTPSKSMLSSVSVSPLRRAFATLNMSSSPSPLPQPSNSPSTTSRIPRSSIPTLTRPPLARLPP